MKLISALVLFAAVSPLESTQQHHDLMAEQCRTECNSSGFKCNPYKVFDSNIHLSCEQACLIRNRDLKMKRGTCREHCKAPIKFMEGGITIGNHKYSLDSCEGKDKEPFFNHNAYLLGDKQPCYAGCAINLKTSKSKSKGKRKRNPTNRAPERSQFKFDTGICMSQCFEAGWKRCYNNWEFSMEMRMSCTQACLVRRGGTTQKKCLPLCDSNRDSTNVNGWTYNHLHGDVLSEAVMRDIQHSQRMQSQSPRPGGVYAGNSGFLSQKFCKEGSAEELASGDSCRAGCAMPVIKMGGRRMDENEGNTSEEGLDTGYNGQNRNPEEKSDFELSNDVLV